MKRVFSLLLIAGMTLGIACSPEEELEPIFKLTSPAVVQFEAEGGQGEISYSLENPTDGTKVTATTEADWITDIAVGQSVTFTVAPNESYDERSERIAISYGEDRHFVRVTQRRAELTADVEQSLDYMFCVFYDKEDFGEKSHTYLLGLCDQPFNQDDETVAPYGATYYRFVLCSNTGAADTNNKIPNGTYTLDTTQSHNTIDASRSMGWDGEGLSFRYEEVTLTVTDDHIEALLRIKDGNVRHIIYNGTTEITDSDDNRTGNLTGDLQVTINDSVAPMCYTQSIYRSDYMNGYNLHEVMIVEDITTMTGHAFVLYLYNKQNNPSGTYTQFDSNADTAEFTFLPGTYNEATEELAGSWYATTQEGEVTTTDVMAPLVEGTITLTQDGTDCTITIDCYDEVGNHITADIETPYEWVDGDKFGAPAAIARLPW